MRPAAFTLVELLIVIVIIGILAALLIVSMSGAVQLRDQTVCAGNLHYLYQGLEMRRSDSLQSRRPAMRVTHWATRWGVLPYVDFDQDILLCPAPAATEAVTEAEVTWDVETLDQWGGFDADAEEILKQGAFKTVDIADLVTVETNSGWFTTDLEPGPFCAKLSTTQFNEVNIREGESVLDSLPEYMPDGNYNEYWFCIEDCQQPRWDDDYNDVMIKVTDNEDGTFELTMQKNARYKHELISKQGDDIRIDIPEDWIQVSIGEVQEVNEGAVGGYESTLKPYESSVTSETATFVTNYGLNAQSTIRKADPRYLSDEPGRILLLDYYKPLAEAADGLDPKWPSPGATPTFARHRGRINVLFTDGAVKAMKPEEINPQVPENQYRYWGP